MVFPKEKQRRALAKLDLAELQARRSEPAFQDLKLCNCARCNAELIGELDSNRHQHSTRYNIPVVFGRMLGRPYCQRCYREVQQFQGLNEQPPADQPSQQALLSHPDARP
jgi:hypothetical protein